MNFLFKRYSHFLNDSLYRNSLYLMASTAVMAGLGFLFWIINARIYSAEQIGLATTLISVSTLIANLSLLGFNNGIIRYLPKSINKNKLINTAIVLVSIAAVIFSATYLIGIPVLSPKLSFARVNLVTGISFIFFMVFIALNPIMESIFIAYRSAGFVLFKNSFFSILKIIFTVILIGFGSYGIFTSLAVAYIFAFFICIFLLFKKFNYKFIPKINLDTVREIGRFSSANYVAYFIAGFPSLFLPIIITNRLGPKLSAFFYIDTMIVGLLSIISIATTQSLLAEGSHNELKLKEHLKKASIIISSLLLPGVIVTLIFGKYLLMFFGRTYAQEGVILLQLLAVSGLFSAVSYIGNALLNIYHKTKKLIIINSINAFLILFLSYCFIHYGLLGIGIAFILSQIIVGIIQGINIFYLLKNK